VPLIQSLFAGVRVPSSLAGVPLAMSRTGDERPVPGVGGPFSDERSADGQSGLRLHAAIASIAAVLCAFVTVIFVRLGSVPLALVFGVVGVLCLVVLGWALYRRNRGKRRA